MAGGRVGDDEGTTKRRGDDGIQRRIGASTEVARGGDGYHARSRRRGGVTRGASRGRASRAAVARDGSLSRREAFSERALGSWTRARTARSPSSMRGEMERTSVFGMVSMRRSRVRRGGRARVGVAASRKVNRFVRCDVLLV